MNALGKFLRKFRIDQDNISLRDMAKKLDMSSSLLSAYETGRREVPDVDSFVHRLLESFPMSVGEQMKLRKSIDKTLESYRVDLSSISPDVRDRYVEFARKIDTFTIEDFEKLGLGDEEE